MPTGGTLDSRDVTTGLSEAVEIKMMELEWAWWTIRD